MIQVYKKINKSLVEVEPDLVVEGYDFTDQWVHMSNPTDKEIELVCKATQIPEEYVKAALDSEERAHIEKRRQHAYGRHRHSDNGRRRRQIHLFHPAFRFYLKRKYDNHRLS
ncbi:MAG: hypothetical protein L6V83_05900 [Christensenella sp.]|nr:MAG: hypothetical protein L6V83_05900 [Christensenella sp.]